MPDLGCGEIEKLTLFKFLIAFISSINLSTLTLNFSLDKKRQIFNCELFFFFMSFI